MKLSVVIVSYNVRYYLWQCLRSVFRATEGIDTEVFVVDNNSTDDSIAFLQQHFPQVHYIQNHENVGFARANNQAIRQAQGEYVLLLNPDTLVTEHTFVDCINFLDSNPEVGATGVAMHDACGVFALESRRGLPTPWVSFCHMSGLSRLFSQSQTLGRYHMRYLPQDKPVEIDVISGAFNMLRRSVLEEIGLLDERFFMYGEDIELSYRVQLAGWKNYYLPTPILHYKGESTQTESYRYVRIFYDAMLLFFDKHFGKRYFLFGMLIRLAVVLRAGMAMLARVLRKITRRRAAQKDSTTDYLSFDSDAVSYGEMLAQLIASDHTQPLATVNNRISVMITPREILPC